MKNGSLRGSRVKLELIARVWVDGNLDTFLDPRMRGDNFQWSNFPRLMGRLMYANIFMSFARPLKEKEKRYAAACAIKRGRHLVRVMRKIRELGDEQFD